MDNRWRSFLLLAILFFLATSLIFSTSVRAETIDILDYFVSDHAIGGKSYPQSLNFTQYVSGNVSFYVKNTNIYEYHTWDDNYIYLKQDNSVGDFPIGGGIANSYRLYPGIWMKRKMQVGEKIDVPTQVDWYNKFCSVIKHWDNWGYYVYLENYIGNYPAGGDLGNQEVIVLRYDYGSGFEKFYYSKEWGWIRWEEWDAETNKVKRELNINRFSKPLKLIKTVCGTPLPKFPSSTPANAIDGDANGDGKVDGVDYVVWLNHYQKNTSKGVIEGDFNKNGKVDGVDYIIWLNNLG